MSAVAWHDQLEAFFEHRAMRISAEPTLEALCYVAGRDPRLWRDRAISDELASSIISLMHAGEDSNVLEVGCAAGFLAMLVAPRVNRFTGVDLAKEALAVARRLKLPNANFETADGRNLPFPDNHFDCCFCHHVFINFPSFADGLPIISEMLRVVRPGGRVLIGDIPDRAKAAELPEHVVRVSRELESRFGPLPTPPPEPEVVTPSVVPAVVTYDFSREEFVSAGDELRARVEIHEAHAMNPYFGYRFNATYLSEGYEGS
jgi:SAM-dependent methyltransferase